MSTAQTVTRRGLLGAGLGLAAGAAAGRADQDRAPLVVWAVRHAEKGTGNDPALTEVGVARAARLATVLKDVPFTAILSTDTRRTRGTAEPIAKARSLEVEVYEVGELSLADQTGVALVVGHSNTIPGLLRDLGADFAVKELEGHDDLFLVVRPAGAAPKPVFQRLHYGA